MKISRLRLLGFKSFVEPTELIIEPGLTGVVGPNGCGKSNLLEALRWVMGETSHKSMRAAAMDDVIFSGTNTRPARNTAEVTIFLDNSERRAPAEFNDTDQIEITRRIEREAGSAYRINGREARARDIKILFEDAATGARSPALVRQGQIGEIVNAKPEQRRRILEDAAGIAGLHSRRHEAELRLKATEANLARLSDVLGQLNSQVDSLKRQARAARRYKEISDDIRRQDALLMHLAWTDAQAHVDGEEANLRDALSKFATATEAESQALAAEGELAERMDPLRGEEGKRAGILGRLRVEQENFEREAARAAERERELRARAEQLGSDTAREEALIGEARQLLSDLGSEIEALARAEAAAGDGEREARTRLDGAQETLREAEANLAELTTKVAEHRARKQNIESGLTDKQNTVAKLTRQLTELGAQTREIAGRAPDAEKLAQITEAGQQLADQIAKFELQALAAEDNARSIVTLADTAREESGKARLRLASLRTERETLIKLLIGARPRNSRPSSIACASSRATRRRSGPRSEKTSRRQRPRKPPFTGDMSRCRVRIRRFPPASSRWLRTSRRRRSSTAACARPASSPAASRVTSCSPPLKPGQRLVTRAGDLWRLG